MAINGLKKESRSVALTAYQPQLHWENYVSISFHIEWDMIVVTVFLLNQLEFPLVQYQKENCYYDHIPFNVKGNGNIVFSVLGERWRQYWKVFQGKKLVDMCRRGKKDEKVRSKDRFFWRILPRTGSNVKGFIYCKHIARSFLNCLYIMHFFGMQWTMAC